MGNTEFVNDLMKAFPEEYLTEGTYSIEIEKFNKSGHCEYNGTINGISEIDALRIYLYATIHYPLAQIVIDDNRKRYAYKREYKTVLYWEECP